MDSKNKSSGGPGSGSGKKSQRADHSEAAASSRTSPVAEASAADSSATVSSTKPSAVSPQSAKLPKRRFRRFRRLVELPTKIPGKIEEGIEKGIETVEKGVTATVDILKDPVGTVQQVVEALQAPRGLVLGWAIALLLPLVVYLLDLGAGSLWHGPDAQVALSLEAMSRDQLGLYAAERLLPPPTGAPLGLWQMAQTVGLLGINEATLRLLPVLAALGSAMCLLAISIDVGVGRHAGGLAGLVLLSLPLTYELSHRVLPDMLIAVASAGAIALVSHSLHGHKFDRHILPVHRDADGPEPLPLRRLPMLFASLGIGAAAQVDPRAGALALGFALLDMLVSHRYLLRKRRVWLMLGGGMVLTAVAIWHHPSHLSGYLHWPSGQELLRKFQAVWQAVWHQGDTRFARHAGQVVVVTTCFGLLLGSLRRASRPLLMWIVLAVGLTVLSPDVGPPRGLGLLLPPLALCAAVGLQSPMRWLGALGGLVTTGALLSVILVYSEGAPVLHKNDTIKLLSQSLRHAPKEAKVCVVGMSPQVAVFYSHREIEEFASVDALAKTLRPGQLFNCLLPKAQLPALLLLLNPPAPKAVKPGKAAAEPTPRSGKRPGAKAVKEVPRVEQVEGGLDAIGSVLATTLDIEEPPLGTDGPEVVLVSR